MDCSDLVLHPDSGDSFRVDCAVPWMMQQFGVSVARMGLPFPSGQRAVSYYVKLFVADIFSPGAALEAVNAQLGDRLCCQV